MSEIESQPTTNKFNDLTEDDNDDDDDQINSSYKIVPKIHQPITSEINNSDFNIESLMKTDLKTYLNTIIPKDYSNFIHCHIKRDKKGYSTNFSLYFDGENENNQIFILYAKKHLTFGGHVEYSIEYDPNKSTNENIIGKLKGINISATEYIFYQQQNQQSLAIIYDAHVFGSREPRKLTVLLSDNQQTISSIKSNETIINQWHSGHLNNFIELKNQTPTYDQESKIYTLNMYQNRIKQSSHKNFQLITLDDNLQENNIAMQFGRIDDQNFSLDYRYPLTAIQAFAIGLSSFHSRFRP